jgi:hypothetical protein
MIQDIYMVFNVAVVFSKKSADALYLNCWREIFLKFLDTKGRKM